METNKTYQNKITSLWFAIIALSALSLFIFVFSCNRELKLAAYRDAFQESYRLMKYDLNYHITRGEISKDTIDGVIYNMCCREPEYNGIGYEMATFIHETEGLNSIGKNPSYISHYYLPEK